MLAPSLPSAVLKLNSTSVNCLLAPRSQKTSSVYSIRSTRWGSWLKHFATSQNVSASIPDGVTGIFHWHNPSGRTVDLRSTQPLMENKNLEYFLAGKGGRCEGSQPGHLPITTVLKSRSLNLLEPSGIAL